MEEQTNFGGSKLTSISLDYADSKWIKDNNVKLKNVIKAGIEHLKEGNRVVVLNEKILNLESNLARSKAHREIIFWIFKTHPDIYMEAKKATGDGV
jgi:hypothetical protein